MPRSKNKQGWSDVDEPIKPHRDDAQRRSDMAVNDPFNLERFVTAQASIFDTALGELGAGKKRSHWMWFVFPQLRGLGSSPTAVRFGISSADEARAYLGHVLLGSRLRECARLVARIDGRSARDVFGWPDDMKLRSSMTLFAHAADDN